MKFTSAGARPRAQAYDNKALVMVAVEDVEGKIGRIRLLQIPDRTAATLRAAVSNWSILGRKFAPTSITAIGVWKATNMRPCSGVHPHQKTRCPWPTG